MQDLYHQPSVSEIPWHNFRPQRKVTANTIPSCKPYKPKA